MKIKYLGTAAYEGVPALFCNCRVCKLSRELGGRNLRSRSQALINDELLLDFNADTVWHYQKYDFSWERICGCLVTHSHCDHLYIGDMEMAASNYTHKHRNLSVFAAKDGCEKIKSLIGGTNCGIIATLVEPDRRFQIGEYDVLPLWADHEQRSSPVIYAIAHNKKRMLYAHDTGYFPEKSFELLKKEGYFDLLSLDCTGCLALEARDGDWVNGHMRLATNIKVLECMKEYGIVDDKTIVVLNHFSHNGGQTYDEMQKAVEEYGFIVAYDGLEINF